MPARLEIDAGVPLHGTVRVSAAQTAALPTLASDLRASASLVLGALGARLERRR